MPFIINGIKNLLNFCPYFNGYYIIVDFKFLLYIVLFRLSFNIILTKRNKIFQIATMDIAFIGSSPEYFFFLIRIIFCSQESSLNLPINLSNPPYNISFLIYFYTQVFVFIIESRS